MTRGGTQMRYKDFVDTDALGSFKTRLAEALQETVGFPEYLGVRIIPESIGEAAILIDLGYDFLLAVSNDGVGTKSKIADAFHLSAAFAKKPLYKQIAQDVIFANTNDLLCVGATPFYALNEIAAGSATWFADPRVAEEVPAGFREACASAKMAMASGETAVLPDLLEWNASFFTGAALGIVRPKTNAVLGAKLAAGDAILGLASSGLHANGLTLVRKIAQRSPSCRLHTILPNGKTLAEEALTPTRDYSGVIQAMREAGVEFHYLSHITGSGWRKIMRAKQSFTYVITRVPKTPLIFSFLQKAGNISAEEAYQTWNMGIGFVVILPRKHVRQARQIAKTYGIAGHMLGHIETGEKRLVIKSKNITYMPA